MELDDLYRILEIDPDADAEAIDAAYWKLAVRYSSGEQLPEDAEMMDEVTRAYEVLSDPQQRAKYDKSREGPASPPRRPTLRIPKLPAGTLDSLGRRLASVPRAFTGLLARLRLPRPSRRLALAAGIVGIVAVGLVVGLVYSPDFGGDDGPSLSPGAPASAIGPMPTSTPRPTPTPTPVPTSTLRPTPPPPTPQPASAPPVTREPGAASPGPLPTEALDADLALFAILEALGQIEGRLQMVESQLDPPSDAPGQGQGDHPTPAATATPAPTPAPAPTPTPTPVDLGQLNWVERYEYENGVLPGIPGWLAPLVEDAEEGDTVESRTVLIPTAQQWCHSLRPSDRLKLLDYVTWLGYHYEDWVWEVGRAIGEDWLSRCPPAASY